ncbi:MAG: heparinase II/III family protein, partial [Anaerolineales bacterium]
HEINRIKKERLFSIAENEFPKIHRWTTTENYDLLEASHRGYKHINNSITCRRQFFLDKNELVFIVRDILDGNGRYNLEWRWYFSPSVDVDIHKNLIIIKDKNMQVLLSMNFLNVEGSRLLKQKGWVSRSYGSKDITTYVDLIVETNLPTDICTTLNPGNENQGTTKAWRRFMKAIKEQPN